MTHRAPNFGTSQWAKPLDRPGEERAECAFRPDLPWTDDKTPEPETYAEMFGVCQNCSRIRRCASEGLADGAFGMYAGVWNPLASRYDSVDVKNQRRRARRALTWTVEQAEKAG